MLRAVLRRTIPLFTAAATLLCLATPRFVSAQTETDETPTPLVRGLSWDVLGGGVPNAGALAQGEIGFSIIRGAYHHSLGNGFSVGGSLGIDYARWRPESSFRPALVLAVPLRLRLAHGSGWSAGLRAEPGLSFGSRPFTFGVPLFVGASSLWTVESRFLLGLGVDIPAFFGIPKGSRVFLSLPVMLGPIAEFHLTPPLAVTLDAKAGFDFTTQGSPNAVLRILLGFAYRL